MKYTLDLIVVGLAKNPYFLQKLYFFLELMILEMP